MLSKAGSEKEAGSKMEEGFPAASPNIRTSASSLGMLKEQTCFIYKWLQDVKNLENH